MKTRCRTSGRRRRIPIPDTFPPSAAPPKAEPGDFPGRFREILSDPLNLLIERHPLAGTITGNEVVLNNGNRVPLRGNRAYYEGFSDILVLNRGVHEPLEEFAFQEMMPHLSKAPVMLELGAYWAHYSMWLGRARPAARLTMVEPDPGNAAAGRENLARNGIAGDYIEDLVGPGHFTLDGWMVATGTDRHDILHSDIQGAEAAMLDGAARTLDARRVDYWFVSTHSQALHAEVTERLAAAGYRIELQADFDHETTSFDGVILAVHPDRPRLYAGPPPMGRAGLARASGREILDHLAAVDAGRVSRS